MSESLTADQMTKIASIAKYHHWGAGFTAFWFVGWATTKGFALDDVIAAELEEETKHERNLVLSEQIEKRIAANRSNRYPAYRITALDQGQPPKARCKLLGVPYSVLRRADTCDLDEMIELPRPLPSVEEARRFYDNYWRDKMTRQFGRFQKRVAAASR